MDLYLQVEQARKSVQDTPLNCEENIIRLHTDFLSQLILLTEEHLQDHYKEWENAALAKEFLRYAQPLMEQHSSLDKLFTICQRFANTFDERPRLKLQLLNFEKKLLREQNLPEVEKNAISQQLGRDIKGLERNIALADSGKLDQIEGDDFFKTDPVEWTEEWENCIDDVYAKVEQKMGEPGFVMGISLQYWALKTEVLKEFGIVWKSPAVMNPDILFD